MLKLNAGFSRKIGEPNYGSRGASVNVELEVESNLIGDPDALRRRIRQLFELARNSVDVELNGQHSQPGPSKNGNGSASTRRDNTSNYGDRPVRFATASQVRAIRSIGKRQNVDPNRLANERFRVNDLEELTIREASTLIDELKNAPTSGRNGGGWT